MLCIRIKIVLPVLLVYLFVSIFGCSDVSQSANLITPSKTSLNSYPDIFVIVIDALRADHLGVYGYTRDTSPFLDQLSEQSLIFSRAYAPSTFTRESVSAILTGRYPSSNPWGTGWRAQVSPDITTISEVFKQNGYETFLFTDQPALESYMYGKGFNHVEVLTSDYGLSGNGPRLVEQLLKTINNINSDLPIFAYIHFYDPHDPYEPPPSYYLRFKDKIYQRPLRVYDDIRFHLNELVQQGFGSGDPRFDDLIVRYDAEIALSDDCIKTLYRSIEKLRSGKKSVWVVTADHGEEFLDHGFVEHAWHLYFETIRVPLIIHAPFIGIKKRWVHSETSLVDLFPTLITLAGFNYIDKGWDGISLPVADLLSGENVPEIGNRIIFSELYLPTRTIGRSLIQDGWQYLNWQQWLTWQECVEYAQKQKQLRDEYDKGIRHPIPFCGETKFEELIAPNDKGFPSTFVPVTEQEERWRMFREAWRKWCANRPEPISDHEKMRLNPPPVKSENQKEADSPITPQIQDSINNSGYF
ncbi:MAG: sulfatase [Candidatus Hydrogenedens sp.]|nr:sulfatase [Candidatus Hydrogenedens sp.]